jgi:hypothetical protein
MGFAVERVDAAGAERAMEGLQLMGRAREDPEQPLPEQPSAEPSSSTHPLAG